MKPRRSLLSESCRVMLGLAFVLLLLPASLQTRAQARGDNPCSTLPQACRYTWDPRERCCIADPRFDCYDICFSTTGDATATCERF